MPQNPIAFPGMRKQYSPFCFFFHKSLSQITKIFINNHLHDIYVLACPGAFSQGQFPPCMPMMPQQLNCPSGFIPNPGVNPIYGGMQGGAPINYSGIPSK